jgi:hypothetical protein
MKEITGDLWDYYNKPGFVVCITTNCCVTKNGRAVMGKGIALQAKLRIPDIDLDLGCWLRSYPTGGVHLLDNGKIMVFPTKYDWRLKSPISLIQRSAYQLGLGAKAHSDWTFILPRPGCANGGLEWEEVRPLLKDLPDNVWIIERKKNAD